MKISARNHWTGVVKGIMKGPVSTEVILTIAPGIEVVAIISTHSAEALGLDIGKPAQAFVKASSVLVGTE